jgi:hypothetical protein
VRSYHRFRSYLLIVIRPEVEEANKVSPRHSRICPGMILVTSPRKLLDRTTKGTPHREAILANYKAEIEEAYRKRDIRLRGKRPGSTKKKNKKGTKQKYEHMSS